MNKVLIADNVSDAVFRVFEKYKIEYDQKVGLSEDEICAEIGNYSGLVIRSAVTVTEKIIESANEAIKNEKNAAVSDIKKQVASLSIEIAEKLLKEKLSDDNKQMQIVEELLKDVKLK